MNRYIPCIIEQLDIFQCFHNIYHNKLSQYIVMYYWVLFSAATGRVTSLLLLVQPPPRLTPSGDNPLDPSSDVIRTSISDQAPRKKSTKSFIYRSPPPFARSTSPPSPFTRLPHLVLSFHCYWSNCTQKCIIGRGA
jgi:hypothetical protein